MECDRTDRQILQLLQSDGRMSNTDVAERVHLSPSACLRRTKRLEEEGLIEGYRMLLNQQAIGKPTNVFVEISLKSQNEEILDAFERAVIQCPDIMECYLMAGDADYVVRVIATDVADYERIHRTYLSRLPGVARLRSSFALRTVCHKTALPLE
ncbi:MAG TPA: Lrp/AsnC family transcriptional regulator [Candidatus Competibacteraceae bacterium]|nr:Lrp/AsnC family transcriptional regulator [Candidatus Competibacteraceae bacterium]MCP5133591.1 Lrp/AsnC family transcriptional regulator [Gammaproteobacteria bacterium]HPF60141.1 Lrp/AsnC family transcriptional regulator [Candidatus Competibacteraceae bacterium]HRY19839.1 Lrp/AsnC family transcriptional regulator [Candidatus Competibacteraceae bacterium]